MPTNPLARLEAALEGLVEGGLTARLRGSVEPAEIAKRLERELGRERKVGPEGADLVPNAWTVSLNPADLAQLEPFRGPLQAELAAFLASEARDRGFALRGRLTVTLAEDPSLGPRRIGISATWLELDGPPGHTAAIRLDHLPAGDTLTLAVAAPGEPPRILQQVPLPCTLGRDLGCTIPIVDPGISRSHAIIERVQARLGIRDLGSRNGTFVNGEPITRRLLVPGDEIRIGQTRLRIQES